MLGLTSLVLPHLARPTHCKSDEVCGAIDDLVADYWDDDEGETEADEGPGRRRLAFTMWRLSGCPLCRATLMRCIIDHAAHLACIRAELDAKPWLLGTAFKDRWP